MLHRMNALSSLTGTVMAGGWPMARVMAGMSAVPVGHAIDLALFFPNDDLTRHDALIAETRRHLDAEFELLSRMLVDLGVIAK